VFVLAILWGLLDRPIDTGMRVHGEIYDCSFFASRRGYHSCSVHLDTGSDIKASMPRDQLGGVTLGISKGRLVGDVSYWVVNYDSNP
jgi:hypothetical protein